MHRRVGMCFLFSPHRRVAEEATLISEIKNMHFNNQIVFLNFYLFDLGKQNRSNLFGAGSRHSSGCDFVAKSEIWTESQFFAISP